VLKAGSYAGKVLDKAGVQALASVPSREELLSKLLYVMQAPVAGFAAAWVLWPSSAKKPLLNRTAYELI
jgi:ribosomal protein L10